MNIAWIALDWGTSNLRATAMSDSGEIIEKLESRLGMAKVASQGGDFESVLLALIDPWLSPDKTIPVFACGMIGAKQGWMEVKYDTAPCSPVTKLTNIPTNSKRITVSVCAGVKQDSPADVMRGEETQIGGVLFHNPRFDGLICLPGTHTKWAVVTNGEITEFRTFMSGELFSLLAEKSVLSHSVSGDGWNDDAFVGAFLDTYQNPAKFLSKIFSLRAEDLLRGTDPIITKSRLSGYLLGLEINGAREFIEQYEIVTLVGSPLLLHSYKTALNKLEITTKEYSGDSMTIAGLNRVQSGT
ncbi:MAG: 2-dehydro-3-deoxygalactonokinase [Verrucomicrobiales bacterium]|nr:2-dehydro-3-deoxygalactonokinase [Verrucomicrobiales bacterium]